MARPCDHKDNIQDILEGQAPGWAILWCRTCGAIRVSGEHAQGGYYWGWQTWREPERRPGLWARLVAAVRPRRGR